MADATRILRWLIVAEGALILESVVVGIRDEVALPVQLRAYVEADAERSLSSIELLAFSLSVALILVAVVASVGLYLLRSWSRPLHVVSAVSGLLLTPFFGSRGLRPYPVFSRFGGSRRDSRSSLFVSRTAPLRTHSGRGARAAASFNRRLTRT